MRKYCDYTSKASLCISPSIRQNISGTIRWTFISTNCLWMLSMAVDRSSSSKVTKSQGGSLGRGNMGGFLHTDNALYSITFGTYTKWLNHRDAVWDNKWAWLEEQLVCYVGWWGDDPRKGKEQFLGNMCRQPNTPNNNSKLDWSMHCSCTRQGSAWLQALERPSPILVVWGPILKKILRQT